MPDFSVPVSAALLASFVLFAGSFFASADLASDGLASDGLASAGLASEDALDFVALAPLLFSLTLSLPLVVDFKPGSYTIRVRFAPQKNCASELVQMARFQRIVIHAGYCRFRAADIGKLKGG
ncbi:MAG: hypothetical protein V3T62_02855 [Alphaproteobacteria bacterium]